MGKLSRTDLPNDLVENTPGLCWKRVTVNERECLLMDSKGENPPLTQVSKKTLNDKKAEEHILRDILRGMADAFIYMANSFAANEQNTILNLCKSLPTDARNA